MAIELTPLEVSESLRRLKETFQGSYGSIPLLDGEDRVGRMTLEGQKVHLTFRGSIDSFTEILSCFNLGKYSTEEWGLAGRVHAGIYNSFCNVRKSIDENWDRHFSHLDPRNVEFIVEGYSRGSGLATLASAYLTHKFVESRLKVFTYSTMNIFNEEAARSYEQKIPHHWSFICSDDVFPQWIGSSCLGFHSIGTKMIFSPSHSASFSERVRTYAYTHLSKHWLITLLARIFIPSYYWEAHMPETYEEGSILGTGLSQIAFPNRHR
jgi:hypothetical protein